MPPLPDRTLRYFRSILFVLCCLAAAALPDPAVAVCGDGIKDIGEDCDPAFVFVAPCCDAANCKYRGLKTTCRAGSGACDPAERCTGNSSSCPANVVGTSSTVCRESAGICDVAETCNAVNLSCPADSFVSSQTVCRVAAGACDAVENCSGVSAHCPLDTLESNMTKCRAAAASCDLGSLCTGSTPDCPLGEPAPTSTVCRAAAGVCDIAEKCSGQSSYCPADSFVPSATTCRSSAGICDVAEKCTGTSVTCPANALAPSSTVCRAAAGGCDAAERCSGTGASCPADVFASSLTVCRAASGVCDVADQCSGASASCPPDSFAATTLTCRASAGICDAAEKCTGASVDCPANSLASSSTVCRAASGGCDLVEKCTGSSGTCPADAFDPNDLLCDDANMCTADTCVEGSCQSELIPGCPLFLENGSAGDEFGQATSLTSSWLVVGAPASGNESSGTVHVFVPSEDGYIEQTQTDPVALPFQDQDQTTGDLDFGAAVDANANTIVAGAPFDAVTVGDKVSSGSATVFFFNGTSWVQQAKLVDATGLCDELGTDVAVSGDTLVLGAPGGDCALVFERTGSDWALAATLGPAAPGVRFGASVDISADNALIGAPAGTTGSGCSKLGAVYAFRRTGATWELETTIKNPVNGSGPCFGAAVGIDGTVGIVGAPLDDEAATDAGAAYVVEHAGEQWQITQQLLAFPTRNPGDHFGASLDISGSALIIGAPGVAAYLFQNTADSQAMQHRFASKWDALDSYEPPEDQPAELSKFAFSVSVSSGDVAIGAPDEENSVGAVYPAGSTLEAQEICGDGNVTPDEDCDDGNTAWKPGQRCNGACKALACGDPNDSGTVTTADALFALKTAIKSVTCDLSVCDVNKNGVVTTSDALQILKKAVGGTVLLQCP